MNEYTPSTEEVRARYVTDKRRVNETIEQHYLGAPILDYGSEFDRWLATVTVPPATGDEREALMRILWLDKFGKEAEYGSPRIASRVLWRMGVQVDAILAHFTVTPKNGEAHKNE